MIDIPLGKALVPVEADEEHSCYGCLLNGHKFGNEAFCNDIFYCVRANRKDKKTVIFKLVDYPKTASNIANS